jgi:threonylcarbamoyladenosine tRNA methylthiotransferase MtaB
VTPALVRALADRRRGVGFDQLAVIEPATDADARLRFWNADGSTAGACGNATRCIARHLMAAAGTDRLTLRTDHTAIAARDLGGGQTAVNLGAPVFDWQAIPLARAADVTALPIPGAPAALSMGNPHCVFRVDDLAAVDIHARAPRMRPIRCFPSGPMSRRCRCWAATLGCRLNAYETEAMKELSAAAGIEDAVVVNTCAVTAEAVRKARQEIRKLRRANPGAKLIVTGCAAQTEPDLSAMAEVDLVIGNTEKDASRDMDAPRHRFHRRHRTVQVDDIMSVTETAGPSDRRVRHAGPAPMCRCRTAAITAAPSASFPTGAATPAPCPPAWWSTRSSGWWIAGYNEVVLTGVDLTSWGGDLPGTPRLGDLVMRILRLVPDLPRLRISSIDSIEADDGLMLAIATEPRLMPHLHLSLQHGDDLILKRMKRRHLRDDAIAFCEEARRLRPDMTFGADIIAGFPTETEAHFDASLSWWRTAILTWLHVFPYSPRPGTPAPRMPPRLTVDRIDSTWKLNQNKPAAARLGAAAQVADPALAALMRDPPDHWPDG